LLIIPGNYIFKLMKISWKEILAIAVLAVLVTLLSLFYGRDAATGYGTNGMLFDAFYTQRGFPVAFLLTGDIKEFSAISFIVDFLFYFAIIGLVWVGIKFLYKKLGK